MRVSHGWAAFISQNFLTRIPGPDQHAFLIPQLGPSPRWCSFLDNMVDEMAEEVRTTTYDNYKFLTLPDLKAMSLDHLIGKTNLLRPYMHGFFVASKLYDQAKLIANPYAWEEERAKRVKEKVEQERASRIRGTKKVKVNQKLADKLLQRQEKRAQVDTKAGVLGDDRFGKLFDDEDFQVDETSREFQVLNPSTKVDDTGKTIWAPEKYSDQESEGSDSEGSDNDDAISRPKADEGITMKVSSSGTGGRQAKDTALGSRAQKSERPSKNRSGHTVGEKSVSFVPESKKKKSRDTVEFDAKEKRSNAGRRSASTNTFRKL